jgi:hypothetical protein
MVYYLNSKFSKTSLAFFFILKSYSSLHGFSSEREEQSCILDNKLSQVATVAKFIVGSVAGFQSFLTLKKLTESSYNYLKPQGKQKETAKKEIFAFTKSFLLYSALATFCLIEGVRHLQWYKKYKNMPVKKVREKIKNKINPFRKRSTEEEFKF